MFLVKVNEWLFSNEACLSQPEVAPYGCTAMAVGTKFHRVVIQCTEIAQGVDAVFFIGEVRTDCGKEVIASINNAHSLLAVVGHLVGNTEGRFYVGKEGRAKIIEFRNPELSHCVEKEKVGHFVSEPKF